MRMDIFDMAWKIAKDVDFRMPRPVDPPAKYTDPNAVLAFIGSKIPMIHTNRYGLQLPNRDTQGIPMTGGEGGAGIRIGDFGEAMHEGEISSPFSRQHGIGDVMDEIQRASLVRAIMEAGIVDEREIEEALDEAAFADARGTFHTRNNPETRRMDNERGVMTTRLGGGDLDYARS